MSDRPPQRPSASGERYTFAAICGEKRSTHESLFLGGTAPDLNAIAGWTYRGRNLSLASRFLHIRRFIKVLVGDPQASPHPTSIDGFNLWARQSEGLEEPWNESSPARHGFYKVSRVRPEDKENKHPHALVLDYSLGENPWYYPGRVLRDYVVQVYPDDPRLLIGNAYVALGRFRIFGGYFVMERMDRDLL